MMKRIMVFIAMGMSFVPTALASGTGEVAKVADYPAEAVHCGEFGHLDRLPAVNQTVDAPKILKSGTAESANN